MAAEESVFFQEEQKSLEIIEGSSDAPLVQLLNKLYAPKRTSSSILENKGQPSSLPEFEVFTFEHECKLLCEPFVGGNGVLSRACLLGDGCVGKNPAISNHAASNGGIVLTEFVTPAELDAFVQDGNLPSQRRCCILCHRHNVHAAYLSSRKQTTFPSDLLLNCYVNPFGIDDYDPTYVIPAPDDTDWHGVFGSTVGLFLNALVLQQDTGTKKWHINQEAMRYSQARANGIGNNMVDRLYRNVDDPRLYLLDFFQFRTRLTDAFVLFATFDEVCGGPVTQRLKIPSIASTHMTLPEDINKSFIHKLIHYRINRLNTMINECSIIYGERWEFMMILYVDAHVPMQLLMESGQKLTTFSLKYPVWENSLPDLLPYTSRAAVSAMVPRGTSPLEKKKLIGSPQLTLIQLLIKSLPEFSQAKMLHDLFLKALANKEIANTAFALAQCFFLGNFYENRLRPNFFMRKQCIAEFTLSSARAYFASLDNDEHLSLYIMRQYLMVVLPMCPPLNHLISSMIPMQKQTSRIHDSVRMVMISGCDDWKNMLTTETLQQLRKLHKRTPKRKLLPRGALDISSELANNIKRTLMNRGIKRPHGVVFEPAVFDGYAKKLRASASGGTWGDNVPESIESISGVAATAMLEELDYDPVKKPVFVFTGDQIDTPNLEKLNDFALAVDFVQTQQITPLPQALLQTMRAAIAKRFSCDENDWEKLRRVARITFCSHCGPRNFILTAEKLNRKINFVRAAGRQKLSLNINTGVFTCVEKPSCKLFTLSSVDLLQPAASGNGLVGGMLILRDATIVISPCCGHLCRASTIHCHSVNGYSCPVCAQSKRDADTNTKDPRVCAHCSKRSQLKQALENSILLRDELGRVVSYGFCRSHFRAWGKPTNGYLTFDFVTKNMQNRTGSGLVLCPA